MLHKLLQTALLPASLVVAFEEVVVDFHEGCERDLVEVWVVQQIRDYLPDGGLPRQHSVSETLGTQLPDETPRVIRRVRFFVLRFKYSLYY